MAKDIFTAVITNNTTDTYMVVLNGNLEDDKIPELEDFAIIGPGESSADKFSSIDALAVYSLKDNKPIIVKGPEGNSEWWKVPDGNHGSITVDTNGAVSLDTSYDISLTGDASTNHYHIPYTSPTSSQALDWDFKPEYLDALLHERNTKAPAAKTPEPISKLETTNPSLAPTIKAEVLMEYLANNYNLEDRVRILEAMQTRIKEPEHSA